MELVSKLGAAIAERLNAFFHLWIDLNLPPLKKQVGDGSDERDWLFSADHKGIHRRETNGGFDPKLFECTNCGEIPVPPIYTCTFGHIICEDCKKAKKSLPNPTLIIICASEECSGNFEGNLRNSVAEAFVTSAIFPCKFYEDGCNQKIVGAKELSLHHRSCNYRHVKCGGKLVKSKSCDGEWEGSVKDFYAHLTVAHQMQLIFRDKKVILRAKFEISPGISTNTNTATKVSGSGDGNSIGSNIIPSNFLEFIEPAVFLKMRNAQNFVIRPIFVKEENRVFTFVTGFYREVNLEHCNSNFSYMTTGSGSDDHLLEGQQQKKRTIVSIKLRRKTKARILNSDSDSGFLTKREHVWIGPVNSIYDSLQNILEENSGLSIPWTDLMKDPNASIVSDDVVTWELDVDIFPDNEEEDKSTSKANSSETSESGSNRNGTVPTSKSVPKSFLKAIQKKSLPWYIRPFFASAWVVIAPMFTISLMLFFVFFV